MSEVATKPAVVPAKGLAPMVVQVVGKVLRVRRHELNTLTTIISPAPDAYSKPAVVEVRSKSRFADTEEEGTWTCRLGGYEGRAFRAVDRDSGESRSVIPVNLYLDLVQ
jgi:hypothetical protein